jgi:hypothetical protein
MAIKLTNVTVYGDFILFYPFFPLMDFTGHFLPLFSGDF